LPELVIDHKHRQFVSPRPRLVIADDDVFVRAMLAAQLDQMFECVGTAVDARTAVALVVAQRPDVVILDVNMPGGGAMHATREIRKQSPDTAIVVLSIDEVRGDMSELLKAGAMTYLRKGIDERTLSRKLVAAIEGHRRNLQSAKPGNNTV
jgi:DNA-binding NarL/FixJ family response regulator